MRKLIFAFLSWLPVLPRLPLISCASFVCFASFILRCPVSFAEGRPVEYGLFLGRLLPSGPEGVTEIIGVGGGRFGITTSPNFTYELGFTGGAAGGVVWQDLSGDMRLDIPVQDLVTHVGAGLDAIHYSTKIAQDDMYYQPLYDANNNRVYAPLSKTVMGLHIFGGLQSQLAGPLWLRADMKLNLTPKLILTITAGVELRFGAPSAAADADGGSGGGAGSGGGK